MDKLLIALVRIYQCTVSNLLPSTCRFQPSCSQYALEALRRHGAAQGTLLVLRRLLRCHPFSSGGYDPVPETGARHRLFCGRREGVQQ